MAKLMIFPLLALPGKGTDCAPITRATLMSKPPYSFARNKSLFSPKMYFNVPSIHSIFNVLVLNSSHLLSESLLKKSQKYGGIKKEDVSCLSSLPTKSFPSR